MHHRLSEALATSPDRLVSLAKAVVPGRARADLLDAIDRAQQSGGVIEQLGGVSVLRKTGALAGGLEITTCEVA